MTPGLKIRLSECCHFVTNLYIGGVIFVVYKLATLTMLPDAESSFMVGCKQTVQLCGPSCQ